MKNYVITILFWYSGVVNAATVTTIDFNSASFSDQACYTEGGVTFSVDEAVLATATGPNGTTAVKSDPFSTPNSFRADMTGGATSVSVDLGDFGLLDLVSDTDFLFMKAYNAAGELIGSAESDCCLFGNNWATLAVSTSSDLISYVTFGGEDLKVLGVTLFPANSVYFDNFTFTTPAAVPLPASVWLFGSGLLGLAGICKRTKSAS